MSSLLPPLRRSAAVQGRVIYALLMREILTRYGRHNIGFLWLFAEPMLFTTGVTILWTLAKSVHGSSLPIVAFALTGYSSVLLWRNMPTRCIGAIEPNLALMYHRNVRVIDVFLARLLLEAGGATISFVTLSLFYIYIGWLEPPDNVLTVIQGWLLIAWFGAGLGMLLGALAEKSDIVERLWHPVSYIAFPLSGAAFMVDALPQAAQHYILYVPMVNGVELVREGYFGNQVRAHYDLPYLVACCLVISLLALAQVAVVNREVTPE
ncbi:ABC-2 type transport system permease protein/capsular polysaccharide transport system permease protein [Sphingobium sp. B1D7B]|uniref:ABC transporter permease n=1 Tax=unclassified Sphingobium TaxID=2611147 RepID=UPI002224A660|nr:MULTISPECIES: ABC transporter permease [unclassified Sphingobium]MCW2391908.1 ABC-2 type transport system permease protein/capsular polysaccharide transport system permease protein [Sphingobium sp. B11D3A]MCW2403664.1 ABC-2 type transport system permease protein/capsular polysaccharide transport system permease protein [Sphingobium sp. B1D7B]